MKLYAIEVLDKEFKRTNLTLCARVEEADQVLEKELEQFKGDIYLYELDIPSSEMKHFYRPQ